MHSTTLTLAESLRGTAHRLSAAGVHDHLIIFDEHHLHRVLRNYLAYYHQCRTHLSLNKDAPEGRVPESAEIGKIQAIPVVGGLHHHYTRRAS